MLDLGAGIEARNYGLGRASNPRSLLEPLKIILPVAVIAGVLSFHVWVRGQNIQIGYQTQQLRAQEEELLQMQQQLILEEQTLKDPEWLEAIAREKLDMIVLRPYQIIPAHLFENWDRSSSETPGPGKLLQPSEPRKPSAFN